MTNHEIQILQPELVLRRFRSDNPANPQTFACFFLAVARKDEDLCANVRLGNEREFIFAGQRKKWHHSNHWSLADYPEIISRFIEFAEPRIAANTDEADFWIAIALALSNSKQIWDFLVHKAPIDAIERINELDFFRSLSQRFPDIEWFLSQYHASLVQHPDSRITKQCLIDAEELLGLLRDIYPKGSGKGLHKKIRRKIHEDASVLFASLPRDEQLHIIRLCLERYFFLAEQPISAYGSCPVDSPTHELFLHASETVWRGLLESDLDGLWRERLHRDFLGSQVDFFAGLRKEFPPRFPHQRQNFDYQHSPRDERVWNRYMKSVAVEFLDLVPEWFGSWHNCLLSRSNFQQDTDVLVQQIEETQILFAAINQIYQRRPNLGDPNRVDDQSRELEKLKQYFLSGDTIPINDWFRQNYPE
jgi:hypothetical protein